MAYDPPMPFQLFLIALQPRTAYHLPSHCPFNYILFESYGGNSYLYQNNDTEPKLPYLDTIGAQ